MSTWQRLRRAPTGGMKGNRPCRGSGLSGSRPIRLEPLEERRLLSTVSLFQNTLDSDPGWVGEGRWAFGSPTEGCDTTNGNPDPGAGYTVTATAGDRMADIRGVKWHDLDADGVRDAGEPGMAGVTVYLDLNGNGVLDSGSEPERVTLADDPGTPEDEAGQYEFANLTPGDYQVREVVPSGYDATYPTAPSPGTGELSFVESLRDDDGGVAGLDWVRAVAVSPDGKHVYTVGYYDNALSVFSRDPVTGEMTFLQVLREGEDGIDHLYYPYDVTVSPDGTQVFAVSSYDDALTVFDRDGATGLLTLSQTFVELAGGVSGLDAPQSVAVSPDGTGVYVASMSQTVAVFQRNPVDGQLACVGVTAGTYGYLTKVTVSPDGNHVYALSSSSDSLYVLERDSVTQELAYVETHVHDTAVEDGLDGANDLSISPDGTYAYLVGSNDNALAVFDRDGVTGQLTAKQVIKDSDAGVNGLLAPYGVAAGPNNDYVFVASVSDDAVSVYRRDGATGDLAFVGFINDYDVGVDGLDGARDLALSPNADFLYVASTGEDAVTALDWDSGTESLTFVQTLKDSQGGIDGLNQPRAVAVSPDGAHAYAVSVSDSSVATFSRDPSSGQLTFVDVLKREDGVDGLYGAYGVTVSADGNHVYVAAASGHSIATFTRNSTTGQLAFRQVITDSDTGIDGLRGARDVVISPDGEQVYVAGEHDDAIAVFTRDPSTGDLTFLEVVKNGEAGVADLDGPWTVAVSPDGQYVYAPGYMSKSLVIFQRNPSTGDLTYHESLVDGVDADSLGYTSSVVVSPDNQHVYVASYGDHAVEVFRRDGTTGSLVHVETERDGYSGVDGLSGAYDITMAPDGHAVYVVGYYDDGVAAFSRDASTGQLTFSGVLRDGVGGVRGMHRPVGITISPDGSHVYSVQGDDDTLASFARVFGPLGPAAHELCLAAGQILEGVDFGNHDHVAPTVSLSVAAFTSDDTPAVTVTATDNDSLHDGTVVALDIDLTDDGDFDDAGEAGYVTATLAGGSATFDIVPALATGSYELRARLSDPAGNEGVATATMVVDTVPPEVASIVRVGASPTYAPFVDFTVTFNESVSGVDVSDFGLTVSGLAGAVVTGVSGVGATWTVTASAGAGAGTLRLDLVDDDSITNGLGYPLGGSGPVNGSYTSGESYVLEAPAADGVVDVHAVIVSSLSTFSLGPMMAFYDLLTTQHLANPDNIDYLLIDSAVPAEHAEIIDDIATPDNFFASLAAIRGRADGDDLVFVNLEAHGSGYYDNYAEAPYNVAYHGYTGSGPIVDYPDGADQFDMLESEYEFSVFCGGGVRSGSKPYFDFHRGLGQWLTNWYPGVRATRWMPMSHYTDVYVEGVGTLSDNDEDIDWFTDYMLGDLNQDGEIDVDAGEVWDYDGDGIAPYDRYTDTFDEDDWGPIDAFQNDYRNAHSALPGYSYRYFDAGLDNHLDIDINPVSDTGPFEVNGTDLDNNGTIDGIDLNGDGDMADWVAINETLSLWYGSILDDQIAVAMDQIQSGAKIMVTNTCHGGGFVDDLSGPGTITITGSREDGAALAGLMPRLLNEALSIYQGEADADANGRVSIQEAFNHMGLHPHDGISPGFDSFQYDDNGDRVSHEDPLPDGGDGVFGATVFLPAGPAMDLDGDDSSGATGNDYVATFTEGGAAVAIVDSDAAFLDPDGSWTNSLTITITNLQDGAAEQLDADVSGTSISKSYDAATGVLTLSGDAVAAEYQQVLLTVTYQHTAANPNPTDRTIAFLAQDGPFQSNLATTTVSIAWFNDAPVLDNSGDMALTAINENAFDNAGTLVSGLLASAGGDRVTDVDPLVEEGIAVTAADDASGQWQYTLDGTTWLDLGAVSETSARLLPADARLRLVPTAYFAGLIDPAVTFRAWDQTSGTAGDLVNVSTNGGDTAFSAAVETASIAVNNTLGEIHGTVWNDLDEDGTQNGGETGLAGWMVILNDDGDGQVDAGEVSAVTDGSGDYSLLGLAAGAHTVTLVLATDCVQTYPAGSLPHSVTLAEGEVATDLDFGSVNPPATIRGTKWNDLDGDGVRDSGEPGIAGVTIYLDLNGNTIWDAGEPTTLTLDDDPGTTGVDETGTYEFAGLVPGDYFVREMVPTGYEAVYPLAPSPGTGELTRVETIRDDDGGVAGLDGAQAVAVAPDGNHVYVAGYSDYAVAIFSRDSATGSVTFVDAMWDYEVGGLRSPADIVVSPDNAHVYVVARRDNAINVYDRDTTTGLLVQTQRVANGTYGISTMLYPAAVTVTADGTGVYVAAESGDSLTFFSRDPSSGLLTYAGAMTDGAGVDTLDTAVSVTVSPDGNHVYAAAVGDNALSVFSRNATTQELAYTESHVHSDGVADGLHGACDVTVSPDGNYVYVAAKYENAVAVYTRDLATGALTSLQVLQDEQNGVDGIYYATAIETNANGDYVFVAGDYGNSVAAFSRNSTSGELTFVDVIEDSQSGVDGLVNPYGLAFLPTGDDLYVAARGSDSLTVLQWNATTEELSFQQTTKDSEGGVDGLNDARTVVISPDGRFLYVGADDDAAISVFERDPASGQSTFVQAFRYSESPRVLVWPRSITMPADGTHLYVADPHNHSLWVLARDSATGVLSMQQNIRYNDPGISGLFGPRSAAISPDGRYVYVASQYSNAIAVFERDTETGGLVFSEAITGISELDGPYFVAVAPDGAYVYATCTDTDALVVFARDSSSGSLTLSDTVLDGEGGAALDDPRSIALSPAGQSIYVLSMRDYAITRFDRDLASGTHSVEQVLLQTDADVAGLTAPEDLVVSPDGGVVYVASTAYQVGVFARDRTTGDLSFVETVRRGSNDPYGLAVPRAVVVSPDNLHVYVVSGDSDSLDAFARELGPLEPAAHQVTLTSGEIRAGVDFGNFDIEAPEVTLSVASLTNDSPPSVTVTATDNFGLPDGTAVALDVDLNADGDFGDADEVDYVSSTLTGGTGTFAISPAFSDGTYNLRARVSDPTGNEGTSPIATTTVDLTAPIVASIVPEDANPTNATSVAWTVTFSEAVAGVDADDFTLIASGITGATITSVSGSAGTYTVTVGTGSGDGTLGLNLVDDDSIVDQAGNLLAGGLVGDVYTVDKTPPTVDSIVLADASPTGASSVSWTVAFSDSVTGVGTDDFVLAMSGITGASIAGISGSGTTYTVTVDTGSGNGTLGLSLVDNDSIVDVLSRSLVGSSGDDGSFVGEAYEIDKTTPVISVNARTTIDTTPPLSGSVDDPTAAVTVTVAGTVYAANNHGDGTWTLADDTISPALAEGVYDVVARATDGASNVGSDGTIDELRILADVAPTAVDDLFMTLADTVYTTPDVRLNDIALIERPIEVVGFTQPGHGTVVHHGDGTFTYTPNARYQGFDSFTYTIEDTLGRSSSATVQLAVSVGTVDGDWPTFGNGPEHTGYLSGRLGDTRPIPDWSAVLDWNVQVAVADGRVYAVDATTFDSAVVAFDSETGVEQWRYVDNASINPPTFHDGIVYVQMGKHEDSDLVALHADTGVLKWIRPYLQQYDGHSAPTVADGRVWVNDGRYGGMSAYSTDTGVLIHNMNLPQVEGWTPTVDGNVVYSWLRGTLRYYDATAGTQIGSVTRYSSTEQGTSNLVAAKDGIAYVAGGGYAAAIDPATDTVLWSVYDTYTGTPALAHGLVYVPASGGVHALDAATGELRQTFQTDATVGYTIVTDDTLIASTQQRTYLLDLTDGMPRHTIERGGKVTLANNRLFISTMSGDLHTYQFGSADNFMPVAVDDLAVATEDMTTDIDVVANDTDADGDPRIVFEVTDGERGTVEILDDATVRYTPQPDFFRTDTFTYTIRDDAGGFDTGTVTVVVGPVDDAPVALDQSVFVFVDAARIVTLQATDLEPDALTYTVVDLPQHGTLTGTGAERVYTPDSGYVGADSFTFSANDSMLDGNVATVSITVVDVNEAPVAVNDRVVTEPDMAVVFDRVLANDTDREGGTLTLDSYTLPGSGQLSYDGATSTFTYTPNAEFTGIDAFTYTVSDGRGGTDDGTVVITVGTFSATGDWPTFGRSSEHTGYFPATLMGGMPRLEREIEFGSGGMKQVAVADGRVFITDVNGDDVLVALDEQSGIELWDFVFDDDGKLTPPTYADGSVFVYYSDRSAYLASFDAATGEMQWQAGDLVQYPDNMHPTVGGGIVWTNGSYSAGLFGYDQATGVRLYDHTFYNLDEWAPSYADGKLYTHLFNQFEQRDPGTGEVLWSVETTPTFSGYSMGYSVPAISGQEAFVNAGGNLIAFDLADGLAVEDRELWRVTDAYARTPAVADGVVYAMNGANVEARSVTDGTLLQTYATGSPYLTCWQPIVTDDILIVAGSIETHLFDIPSGQLIQTLEGGGQVSLANERLYVAGLGSVRVYRMTGGQHTATPTSIDLLPADDSGYSSVDNITDRDNNAASTLTFEIAGTVPGATVTVYADMTPIGSAVATDVSATITTNGVLDLVDGIQEITARQILPGKAESAVSPLLQLRVDTTAPTVLSVARAGTTPSGDATVDFTVTFSEDVVGVDATDFALATSGELAGANITAVSGASNQYVVTVDTGSDNGWIGLNLVDDDSIEDLAGHSLAGASDGSTTGEVYEIVKSVPIRGTKWRDINRDGVHDAGEPGLPGVTIYLDLNRNGQFDAGEPNVETVDNDPGTPQDETGNYEFAGMTLGTYVVAEVVPAGMVQTYPTLLQGTGDLSYQERYRDSYDGISSMDGPMALTFSPDGNQLYVAATSESKVTVFERNAESGSLTVTQVISYSTTVTNGLRGPRSIAISPDGMNAYISGITGNAVAVFSRDLTTGSLTLLQDFTDGVDGVDGLDDAVWTTVSPDGKHVYVTGADEDKLAIFTRDPSDGRLTFDSVVQNSVNGVLGMDDPSSITVSQDGLHVYVTSFAGDAVTVFDRNATTGALAFTQVLNDNVDTDGLDGARCSTLSPDGAYLYVTSTDDDSVVAFSRNSTTGHLTPLQQVQEGVNGVVGLNGAFNVTTSDDGQHVFATGYYSNALVVLDRDLATGELTYHQTIQDGVDGIDRLVRALPVSVSRDGQHVYVGSHSEDTLSVFRRDLELLGRHRVHITSAAPIEGIDFGNRYLEGDVTGNVWIDPDANGVLDAGESPAEGWTVYVDADGNGTLDSGELSATTAANGSYTLADVPYGTVDVRLVLPVADWEQTLPAGGAARSVAVVPGGVVPGTDFGVRETIGDVSGNLWIDLNADGVDNDGPENDETGFTVFADANSNGVLDVGETSDTTSYGGYYLLTELPLGTIDIRVQLPNADWEQTYPVGDASQAVTVLSGTTVTSIGFGVRHKVGSVSGTVWIDLNGDGVWDAGEMPAKDWAVYVDVNGNGVFDYAEGGEDGPATLVGPDGTYLLTNIEIGTADIGLALWPDDWEQTLPAGGSTRTVSVTDGGVTSGIDFAARPVPPAVMGTVFHDLNEDGVHDPDEPGLEGWVVYWDGDQNGVYNPSVFGEFEPDDYSNGTLLDTVHPDVTLSKPNEPGGNYPDPDVRAREGNSTTGSMVFGSDYGPYWTPYLVLRADFDEPVRSVTIDAIAYTDRAQGKLEAYDASGNLLETYVTANLYVDSTLFPRTETMTITRPVADIAYVVMNADIGYVMLDHLVFGSDGQDVGMLTYADGSYALTGLPNGDLLIGEVPQSGWPQTYPGGSGFHTVSVAGNVVAGVDFGHRGPVPGIYGTVFSDSNANTSFDSSEPGLAGWTVFLDTDSDGQLDVGELSTTTDLYGGYGFPEVGAGTYTVAVLVEPEWVQMAPAGGSHTVNVSDTELLTDVDFGAALPRVYVDADAAPGGDGLSWATAYNDLDLGINAAAGLVNVSIAGLEQIEIWIAEGTYLPNRCEDASDPRTATFAMAARTSLIGGFEGTETSTDQRLRDSEGVLVHATALSGDLGVADDLTDNAYTVAYASYQANLVLDGLTITGGYADAANTNHYGSGGGVFLNRGSATITDVTFIDNHCIYYGGALRPLVATVSIDNCRFIDNHAFLVGPSRPRGGAINIANSNTTYITNSLFEGNTADDRSGAIEIWSTLTTVEDCVFERNEAYGIGGGAVFNDGKSVTYNRVAFVKNATTGLGGAVLTDFRVDVDNCFFHANEASNGGGVYSAYNDGYVYTFIEQSEFIGNRATEYGGAIRGYYTYLNHSTVVANHANVGGGVYSASMMSSIVAYNTAASPLDGPDVSGSVGGQVTFVRNSVGWANASSYIGQAGNLIGTDSSPIDPQFVRPPNDGGDGWGDDPATTGVDESANDDYGDLHLQLTSPAVNAGVTFLPAPVPEGTPEYPNTDLGGDPRIVFGQIDMGAYEYQNNAPTADAGGPYPATVGKTITLDGSASYDPDFPIDSLSFAWDLDGDGLFDDANVVNPEFSTDGYSPGVSTTVALQVTDTEGAVHSDAANVSFSELVPRAYVDTDAAPGGDGLSWATAFNDLDAALDVATEVWIAEGVYLPTRRQDLSDPRSATFKMQANTTLFGGFAGTETSVDQRVRDGYGLLVHETILSGDLGVDDDLTDNAYTVVYANSRENLVLDGLTVTEGYANGDGPTQYDTGGGVFIYGGSATIDDVTFTDNYCIYYGGALRLWSAIVSINESRFFDNHTVLENGSNPRGGAINADSGTTDIANSIFEGNTADDRSGAIELWFSTTTIEDSVFRGNESGDSGAGATFSYGERATYDRVTFVGNRTSGNGGAVAMNGDGGFRKCFFHANSAVNGGAIYDGAGDNNLVWHSQLVGNTASQYGGAIYGYRTFVHFSTVTGNHAETGGGIYATSVVWPVNAIIAGNTVVSTGSGPDLFGSLYADSGPMLIGDSSGWAEADSHIGQNGNLIGTAAAPIDPLFVRAPSDGSDGWGDDPLTPGTDESANDDYGDLRLQLTSPAVNAGSPEVPAGPTDLDDNPRTVHGTIDMGAYEYQNHAPIADAGGLYGVAPEGTVVLDASASTDPNLPVDSLYYAWDFDGDGLFDDATGDSPVFSAAGLAEGTFVTIALRVTDTEGAVHTDSAKIYVFAAPVQLVATEGDDTIVVTPGSATEEIDHVVEINGTHYTYSAVLVNEILIDGLEGTDTITIHGTAENETVALSSGSVDVSGQSYQIRGTNLEAITVDGNAGDDQVSMNGSADSNRLYSYPDYATLSDSTRSYQFRVEGFETVVVNAPEPGRDYAYFYDAPGKDTLDANPDRAILTRGVDTVDETETTATGFQRVSAYATQGDTDEATLTGAAETRNRFYGYADYSILTESRRSFYFYARGFDTVTANSPGDGYTYAYLHDSSGVDSLTATPTTATMDRAAPWSDTTANGFKRVYAYSTRGGEDRTELTGAATGGNQFRGYPTYSTLTDATRSFYHHVRGFRSVTAIGSQADPSGDRAYLYDSTGDDTFSKAFLEDGKNQGASLTDAAGTYENWIKYFDTVYARSSDNGTNDTIDVTNEDELAYNLIRSGTW